MMPHNHFSFLPLSLRFAVREMRGGIRGFRIFLLCLILGVGTIAAVQSVSSALIGTLDKDGREILGADIAVRNIYTPPGEDVQKWLRDRGARLQKTVEMRSNLVLPDTGESLLVELKAIDGAYPLYGELIPPPAPLHADTPQIYLDPALKDRLNVAPGDKVRLGRVAFTVKDFIENEPDKLGSGGFLLAPRAMIGRKWLDQTGLLNDGSMAYHYVKAAFGGSPDLDTMLDKFNAAFPDRGLEVRNFRNAAPELQGFINRLMLFLTLAALTALLVGGLGITNAVRSYMDKRLPVLATLKCLGASGGLLLRIYLCQILLIGMVGIILGVIIGTLGPWLFSPLIRTLLPIDVTIVPTWQSVSTAGLFGLFITLIFSLFPIGQARETPPADLFRDYIAPVRKWPKIDILIMTGVLAVLLCGFAVITAYRPSLAVWFIAGAAATFLIFRLLASLLVFATRRLPSQIGAPVRRLAVANIIRPGNSSAHIILSLGLGLTILVAIGLIEGNFRAAVNENLPDDAPAFFFIDIQPGQLEAFKQTVLSIDGADNVRSAPNIRGRISRVKNMPAAEALKLAEKDWLLDNDRGITYTSEVPPHSRIVAGEWWPPDYDGPPLISIVDDIAEAFDLRPGDTMTINVLGRDIQAEIANIRSNDWTNFTISFTMTLAPGTLENVPQTHLATVRARPDAEAKIARAVTETFPNITVIRLKDAVQAFNSILEKIALAIRIVAAFAIITGILVLAGAVIATHASRIYETVILKVLGAERATLTLAYSLEYVILGLFTALIAGGIGTFGAWAMITKVMDLDWVFQPLTLALTLSIAFIITMLAGLIASWRSLSGKPARYLRNE